MKKTTKGFLVFALAMGLALALSILVSAASAQDVAVFSIDRCFAGNEYALILTKKGAKVTELNNSDIFYINQFTAGNDKIEAAVVYPGFETCDAYVGGSFADGSSSPRKLGTYTSASTPAQLVEIGDNAFENSAFTHVFLGSKVTKIGSCAFANCGSLAYIYIPASVTNIADDAFENCDSFVIGCASGSKAEQYAKEKNIACQMF
ncbi:MAG: leucine-rich repeat domain-containing protein [Blautia sp.]|nr:leucine-rich repeat domain-containing protein [Blautia sp.]